MKGRSLVAALLGVLLLARCGGGPFRFLHLAAGTPHPLNAPLVLEFSAPVAADSVHDRTIRIVCGADGSPAVGRFEVDGARVIFHPRIPRRADLGDAGLRPGAAYRIELAGLPRLSSVRAESGRRLVEGATANLVTASVRLEAEPGRDLFQDPRTGAPRLLSSAVRVAVGEASVDLLFSEPLDPRSIAEADLRLRGPWSTEIDRQSNPRLSATLVENQSRARLRVTVPASLPAPLTVGEGSYEIDVAPGVLRDLGGNPLRDGARINMEVVAELEAVEPEVAGQGRRGS